MLWNEPHVSDPVDYHPYTLAQFTQWLKDKHETIANDLELVTLNAILGAQHPSGAWCTYDISMAGAPHFPPSDFEFNPPLQ